MPSASSVSERFVDGVNGLRMHVLEAGPRGAPCVLLLHGFPELAYSWRKVMPLLAGAGYHVIAPDQRGYGQTTGWDAADLDSFFILNIRASSSATTSARWLRAMPR
jgi:pimeloyl-ACP methyl ester carboxylesterase